MSNKNNNDEEIKKYFGLWSFNTSEKTIKLSSKWFSMLGFKENYAEEKIDVFEKRIFEDDVKSFVETLNKAGQNHGTDTHINYRVLTSAENYKWVSSTVASVTNENNETVVYGIQHDISKIMDENSYLSDIILRYTKLVENFQGGILLETEQRKIFFVNEDFCKFFNIPYSPYSLIGMDCTDAAEQSKDLFESSEIFVDSINKALREKLPVFGEQFQLKSGIILERDYIPLINNKVHKGHLWLYRDITKFKHNEEQLKFMLDFEELIINLSSKLINLEWKDIDKEIDEALGLLGSFIDADRSYVFLFSKDKQEMNNTHEWAAAGVSREKENLQNIPTNIFPWWMERINLQQTINISSVSELPEEAAAEKEILESQDIKSLAVVPLIYKNDVIGYFGFDSVHASKNWTDESIKLLRIASGVITNAIKRKESEEALIKSQAKYKSVVDNIKEVVFQTDAVGLWTFLNPAWTEITGFTIEESINTNFLDYVHPDDRERNRKLFEPLINREKDYCRHEIRYLTKDGGFRWIEVFARLTLDENENIIGTSGTLNNITKRKTSEEEVRKLSRAVETTQSGILLSDLKGIITYVNPGLVEMGRFKSPGELIGKSIFEFTNDEGRNLLTKVVMPELYKSGNWNGEIELIKANKTKFPADMICSIIFDENNLPQHLLANFYDISKRKMAEEEIKNSLLKEKELSELKSKLVSLASHEFRTPLSAILSSSDLLELYWEKWTEEKRISLLQKIKKSVNNLIEILNDVTEINRADSGKTKVVLEDFDLISFMNEIIEELLSGYKEKPNVHVDMNQKSIMVHLDKKLLRQITVNLISNAVKYTPAEKNVYIKVETAKEKLILEVKDEGIGIPEDDYQILFEPFMRSKNAGKIKGTGLGLSIAKNAAERLGGSINFESEINKGSTFYIAIPLKGVKVYESNSDN